MGLGRDGIVDPAEGAGARPADREPAATPLLRRPGLLRPSPAREDDSKTVTRGSPSSGTRLARFLDALTAAGFAPEIISGGGTGTHHLDLAYGPFTEIQPGSYLFMDKQYGEVEIAPGGSPFQDVALP